jgi:hypothetical protein
MKHKEPNNNGDRFPYLTKEDLEAIHARRNGIMHWGKPTFGNYNFNSARSSGGEKVLLRGSTADNSYHDYSVSTSDVLSFTIDKNYEENVEELMKGIKSPKRVMRLPEGVELEYKVPNFIDTLKFQHEVKEHMDKMNQEIFRSMYIDSAIYNTAGSNQAEEPFDLDALKRVKMEFEEMERKRLEKKMAMLANAMKAYFSEMKIEKHILKGDGNHEKVSKKSMPDMGN